MNILLLGLLIPIAFLGYVVYQSVVTLPVLQQFSQTPQRWYGMDDLIGYVQRKSDLSEERISDILLDLIDQENVTFRRDEAFTDEYCRTKINVAETHNDPESEKDVDMCRKVLEHEFPTRCTLRAYNYKYNEKNT